MFVKFPVDITKQKEIRYINIQIWSLVMNASSFTFTLRLREPEKVAISFSPKSIKLRTTWSAGKLMLTLFWNCRCTIMEHYMSWVNTINRESCCDIWEPSETCNQFWYVAAAWQREASHCDSTTNYGPAFEYSPDFAPSDFNVFGSLTEALGGKQFDTDVEIKRG